MTLNYFYAMFIPIEMQNIVPIVNILIFLCQAIQISKSLIRSSNIHRLKQVNYYECSELAERWSSQDFLENLLKFITSENL